ncbi:MAG: hypothetical protein ACM3PU_02305 [Gemmatimonadota bacterium]
MAGKRLFAEAVQIAAPALADAIIDEPDWRHRYPAHIRAQVELAIGQPNVTAAIARRGLDVVYRSFEFWRGGAPLPLDLALRAPCVDSLYTVTIPGHGKDTPRLEVPYRGERLAGSRLVAQVHHWVERGIAEPSFATAIEAVVEHPEWLDLSDWNIAVLGAGAELNPFETLAGWRAMLIAVDVPNPALWRRLIDIARRGNGRVRIPVRKGSSADDAGLPDLAGADLLTEAPQVRHWLATMPEPLAIGCFAYLDGEAHVRLSVAMDAIVNDLLALRRNIVPAYLLTPTDCYAVPARTAEQAVTRWYSRGANRLWQESLRWASRNRLFAPGQLRLIDGPEGFRAGIVDALVIEQGPNYALAKRLQQWRALVARADGVRVSANVAPATRTQSVLRNPALKAAYDGARLFDVEVFEPDTANVLSAALLVHDLRTDSGASAPESALAHPLQLFMEGALHSGLWTTPYAPRSALPLAALAGYVLPERRR